MSIRTQLLKGILDGCILGIIEEQPVYGYELSKKLLKAGLPKISKGTIYPVLLRLQKSGFIRSETMTAASGHNRKYYYLTDNGKNEFESIAKEWRVVAVSFSNLLLKRKSSVIHNDTN
ncbi:PadR family transcriptional regulator [Niallia circulans]|uniref:PadR family transcriptional regulator n=1 Tax=Niallia circulans TaxID=1397 RepID=A0A0J1HQT6_NIACI|nr:PadR family transcriptional regulator [Niallia circulans]KLV16064.1 PadR family transcriptional regulator [Niallia circulans]MED5103017.1 PadR family transcriptional regulator [Niallia circulans]NRG29515.1 PadR family transcriptional regulator [Niallia circulans]